MDKRRTGILIICDYLLLLLLYPLDSGSRRPGLFPGFVMLMGAMLFYYIHFIFRGVNYVHFRRYFYSKTAPLKYFLTWCGVTYLICASFLVYSYVGLDEYRLNFNSIFSFILIYFVGIFYIILIRTYIPDNYRDPEIYGEPEFYGDPEIYGEPEIYGRNRLSLSERRRESRIIETEESVEEERAYRKLVAEIEDEKRKIVEKSEYDNDYEGGVEDGRVFVEELRKRYEG